MRRGDEFEDYPPDEFEPDEYGGVCPEEEEYGGPEEPAWPHEKEPPELVSTSQAVNLTCTLAALSGLFALFLYFADQRSNAVRRVSVQSIGLSAAYLAAGIVIWLVSVTLGMIPFLGFVLKLIFDLIFIALTIVALAFKVRMMMWAYRGYAYQLPVAGRILRRFE